MKRMLVLVGALALIGTLAIAVSAPAWAVGSGNATGSCVSNASHSGWIITVMWKGADPDFFNPSWLTPQSLTDAQREANMLSAEYWQSGPFSLPGEWSFVLYRTHGDWTEPASPPAKTWHVIKIVCPALT